VDVEPGLSAIRRHEEKFQDVGQERAPPCMPLPAKLAGRGQIVSTRRAEREQTASMPPASPTSASSPRALSTGQGLFVVKGVRLRKAQMTARGPLCSKPKEKDPAGKWRAGPVSVTERGYWQSRACGVETQEACRGRKPERARWDSAGRRLDRN
jgi:hypothetical protein